MHYILLSFIVSLCLISPALAAHTGGIEYHDYLFDYTKLDEASLKSDAEAKFADALSETDKKTQEKLLHKSMRNYHVLLKISPNTVEYMNKRGLIYDILNKDLLAKSYFSRSLNLDKDNPETNYLVGDFFYKRRDFKRALRYFSVANENGRNDYDINYKLGVIHEKLGDLCNAKRFYLNAVDIDNSQTFLIEHIKEIPEENSEYHGT